VNVESDRADCVMALKFCSFRGASDGRLGALVIFKAAERVVGETGSLPLLGLLEALAFAIQNQLGVFDKGHPVGVSEFFGPCADEVDMGALLEDEASCLNGIAEALDTRDSTGLHAASVHEESVELNAAIRGEKTSTARIKSGIVLHHSDCGFNGVDGCATAREHGETGF